MPRGHFKRLKPIWNKGLTKETDARVNAYGAAISVALAGKPGRVWTEQQRVDHRVSMKRAVEEHPESYTSSNRGRTKQIIAHGIKFQGSWELIFFEWCLSKQITISRCEQWFNYEWNGTRKYNPDFYLPDRDFYVEIKGYKTEKDEAKWSAFPHKLLIISKMEIEHICKDAFVLPLEL